MRGLEDGQREDERLGGLRMERLTMGRWKAGRSGRWKIEGYDVRMVDRGLEGVLT